MSLAELQKEILRDINIVFPDTNQHIQLMSATEELGELARCEVKQALGIRGTANYWEGEKRKELGETLMNLLAYAERAGIDAEIATREALDRFRAKEFAWQKLGLS